MVERPAPVRTARRPEVAAVEAVADGAVERLEPVDEDRFDEAVLATEVGVDPGGRTPRRWVMFLTVRAAAPSLRIRSSAASTRRSRMGGVDGAIIT
jgi:hypothetical protein